jgi:hypothetical protein
MVDDWRVMYDGFNDKGLHSTEWVWITKDFLNLAFASGCCVAKWPCKNWGCWTQAAAKDRTAATTQWQSDVWLCFSYVLTCDSCDVELVMSFMMNLQWICGIVAMTLWIVEDCGDLWWNCRLLFWIIENCGLFWRLPIPGGLQKRQIIKKMNKFVGYPMFHVTDEFKDPYCHNGAGPWVASNFIG